MLELKVKSLSLPEIAIFAATRGVIGLGAGLLLADKFRKPNRKTIGWSLLLSGIASTVPIAMHLRKKNSAAAAMV